MGRLWSTCGVPGGQGCRTLGTWAAIWRTHLPLLLNLSLPTTRAAQTRLDAAQRRFNEHIAANRDLKSQIDAAGRRAAAMEAMRAQLEREVAGVAAELAAVQEAGRVASEARHEALAQVRGQNLQETLGPSGGSRPPGCGRSDSDAIGAWG